MASKIIKKEGNKITLQLEVEIDPNSMLQSEEQIQQAINEAANQVTQEALERFDTDGRPIKIGAQLQTSKGKKKKVIKRPTEKS